MSKPLLSTVPSKTPPASVGTFFFFFFRLRRCKRTREAPMWRPSEALNHDKWNRWLLKRNRFLCSGSIASIWDASQVSPINTHTHTMLVGVRSDRSCVWHHLMMDCSSLCLISDLLLVFEFKSAYFPSSSNYQLTALVSARSLRDPPGRPLIFWHLSLSNVFLRFLFRRSGSDASEDLLPTELPLH